MKKHVKQHYWRILAVIISDSEKKRFAMQTNRDLYKLILSRRSIRRYLPEQLDNADLSEIEKIEKTIEPLIENNKFSVLLCNYLPDSSSGKVLGGFGRIMKPPHFIAPYISGDGINSYVDLGFRTQQILLEMWSRGIGSCYVGCAHRQKMVKQFLDISDEDQIISFVIFGKSEKNQSLRIYQKISQIFTQSKKRLSYEELFIGNKLPSIFKKRTILNKILEAGRQAPSATNSQPWRFDEKNDRFVIYAHQKKIANIYDLQQGYSFHDTGICMANMSMAAKALGEKIKWHLIDSDDKILSINETDIPIAYFLFDNLRSR